MTPEQPEPEPPPGPTQPEQEITETVAAHPAPERRSGSIFDRQRLKLWYQRLKDGLSHAIDKARDHWQRETTASADRAGWEPHEREWAGIESPAETVSHAKRSAPEPRSVTDTTVGTEGVSHPPGDSQPPGDPEPAPIFDETEREQARQAFQEERGEPVLSREVVQTEDGRWEFEPLTADDEWPQDALDEWEQRQNEIEEQGPSGPTLG